MTTAPPTSTQAQLAQRWNALAPRERVLVATMGGAFVFLLVWLIAVRPAWRTLDQAPAMRAQADAELAQMKALAGEAQTLRALPPVAPNQAESVIKSATERLAGKAKIVVQADRATLTLTGATGADLQQWLNEVRGGARARPVAADLTHVGEGYNGTVVVTLGSGQ